MSLELAAARLAFLGAGNMAEALVKGLVTRRVMPPAGIVVADVREERRRHFQEEYGTDAAPDNPAAVRDADVVVLAVKPQDFAAVIAEVSDLVRPARPLVVSIAAGITTHWLEARLPAGARVVRTMPNTPALVGAGAAALCAGQAATPEDLAVVQQLLEAVGIAAIVPEKDMDMVTALSGSGPAYVFYLMESMMTAARHAGLAMDVARNLVVATIRGSAQLCAESGLPPEHLRARVTSKGGTTEAAFSVLQDRQVHEAFLEAFERARQRAHELAKS